MVQTVIEAIRINVVSEQHVVILKEMDGPRVLPIWIGPDVAHAIALELQGTQMMRPLTHDLLKTVIAELGANVDRVVVNDVRESTFYALVGLDVNGRSIEVDSRPSDAIALAVRTQSPIFVEDHVMDQAGLTLPTETEAEEEQAPAQTDAVETERLSVFRDFVNNLDIEDPEREKD